MALWKVTFIAEDVDERMGGTFKQSCCIAAKDLAEVHTALQAFKLSNDPDVRLQEVLSVKKITEVAIDKYGQRVPGSTEGW